MKNILLVFLALVTLTNTVPEASGQSNLVMKVNIASDANNGTPVAFDLVLVTDEMLLEELGEISASEWFENRNQYRLDYPEETGLSAGSWEFVPGQVVAPQSITVKREIVGGVIFANYFTPGAHRAVINPRKSLTVTLGAEGFTVRVAAVAGSPATPSTPSAPADPVTGEWDASAEIPGQPPSRFTLRLKLEGDKVTGSSDSDQGSTPISKGTWNGNKLTFSLDTPNGAINMNAVLKEGKLVGDFDFAGQFQGKWEAKKK